MTITLERIFISSRSGIVRFCHMPNSNTVGPTTNNTEPVLPPTADRWPSQAQWLVVCACTDGDLETSLDFRVWLLWKHCWLVKNVIVWSNVPSSASYLKVPPANRVDVSLSRLSLTPDITGGEAQCVIGLLADCLVLCVVFCCRYWTSSSRVSSWRDYVIDISKAVSGVTKVTLTDDVTCPLDHTANAHCRGNYKNEMQLIIKNVDWWMM